MLKEVLRLLSLSFFWSAFFSLLLKPVAIAQTISSVTADTSTDTKVTDSGTFSVTEGTLRSADNTATLFHSFETLSPSDSNLTFDLRDTQNAVDTQFVTLILGRVTGSETSFINGELSITRDANTPSPDLFLLNPNGIVFGANARLNLPGSFLASTASSVTFANGEQFSTNKLNNPPLLTVSTPVGLQFANGAGGITVQGSGHDVATFDPTLAPYAQVGANAGLSVETGKTLALMGAEIALQGGVLNAPGGQIALGGVQSGSVALDWNKDVFSTAYDEVEHFGDVKLEAAAIANTSDITAGTIQIQGSNLEILDGSLLWNQNRGPIAGGAINVSASEQFSVSGYRPTFSAFSSLVSETVGSGDAGGINVSSPSIEVQNGGMITSRTFGAGDSQTLTLSSEAVAIDGYVAALPGMFSVVGTVSFSTGEAGDVVGTLGDLYITNGGYLGSTTFGSGTSGDVWLLADDVHLHGTTPLGGSSLISSNTIGPQGSSGDLSLTVRSLTVQDSAAVTTTSASKGDAGNIQVTASEFISVSGQKPGLRSSAIASTVDIPLPSIQQRLGISSVPEGSAGSITLQTPLLEISNSATITVSNLATGNAGQIYVEADAIEVRNAAIDAFTAAGEGGNVSLEVQDVLLMRNGQIRATARGAGNGGNINITSPAVLGIDDSNIVANAVTGDGGNVNLTAREIFGLAFRETLSPESNDITASSEFGVSGTVSIDGFSFEADAGLANLPTEVSDESDRIVNGCGGSDSSQFIASGRGGLSANPAEGIPVTRIWRDLRSSTVEGTVFDSSGANSSGADSSGADSSGADSSITASSITANSIVENATAHRAAADSSAAHGFNLPTALDSPAMLVEATGFQKTASGIALVAETDQPLTHSQPTCLQ